MYSYLIIIYIYDILVNNRYSIKYNSIFLYIYISIGAGFQPSTLFKPQHHVVGGLLLLGIVSLPVLLLMEEILRSPPGM